MITWERLYEFHKDRAEHFAAMIVHADKVLPLLENPPEGAPKLEEKVLQFWRGEAEGFKNSYAFHNDALQLLKGKTA